MSKTGLDAQSGVAKINFSFTPSQWVPPQSHGIRISVCGYKPDNMNYYKSDTETWTTAL